MRKLIALGLALLIVGCEKTIKDVKAPAGARPAVVASVDRAR